MVSFAISRSPRFDATCPLSPAARDPDARQETEKWLIFYGDVQAGSIMRAVGNPGAAPLWQWHCGFYPGSRPGEWSMGTAPSFNQARIAFEAAWRLFLSKRTEADFEDWRRNRGFTCWKDRMHNLALPLRSQKPDGIAHCFCGGVISNPTLYIHILTAHRSIGA